MPFSVSAEIILHFINTYNIRYELRRLTDIHTLDEYLNAFVSGNSSQYRYFRVDFRLHHFVYFFRYKSSFLDRLKRWAIKRRYRVRV